MTTYYTRNPLGSSAAKDLYDNAQNLDHRENDLSNETWPDRLGVPRLTWFGIEKQNQRAIANYGYVTMDSFQAGATLTLPNQVLRDTSTGEYYRWAGTFPKVVAAGSTPSTAGGVGTDAWLSVGDAVLRANLASSADGLGDFLLAVKQPFTGSVLRTQHDKNAESLSVQDFGAIGDGVADDSAAIMLADAVCGALGLILDGRGGTYAIGALTTLVCGNLVNFNFVPKGGYTGNGITFTAPASTGKIHLRKITAKGFTGYGAKVLLGTYTGTPDLTLDSCEFSNNGSLTRTTCINAVNTASDYVIAVDSVSGFAVNDYVWIGDSRCQILSISGTAVTLVNDGTKPTLSGGGTGTSSYPAGQYFTKDGDGKNGLTVGAAGASWNIKTQGVNRFNSNGWFGLFSYTVSASGRLGLRDAEASGNGYCGFGMGYVAEGEISNCRAFSNGNNGIDVFQCDGRLSIFGNRASANGVDGIFAGCVSTAPSIRDNYVPNNLRIGILVNGRTTAPAGLELSNNIATGNTLYGLCLTGVLSADVGGNTVGGSTNAIKVEGKNGLANPAFTAIHDNFFSASSTVDIFANIGGYSDGGNNGAIVLYENNFYARTPVNSISNFDRAQSHFTPEGYINYTASYSATAGSNISVSLSFLKATGSGVADVSAGVFEMQIYANSNLLAASTVDTATRTAGIELANGATTNGKIIASSAFAVCSYNFNLSAAGTRYLHVKSKYGNALITMIWS